MFAVTGTWAMDGRMVERQDEMLAALGVRRGEEGTRVRAEPVSKKAHAIDVQGVEDGEDVVHPCFEAEVSRLVGEAGTAGVEHDEA